MPSPPLFIFGGRSLVAPYLFRLLNTAGHASTVVSRRAMENLPPTFSALTLDLDTAHAWRVPDGANVLSLLPLWVLVRNLARFVGARSLVAVSSTSRFGKAQSEDPKERALAEKLEAAENTLQSWATKTGVPVTLLRPTLIYDGRTDQNITRILRTVRRFGVFPLASPGKGLRQPIHAEDVAKAIMGAMENEKVANKALNIAGGEVLTYRAMVERVFQAQKRTPRFILVPTAWLEHVFRLLSKLGLLRETTFGFGVFRRMNQDLVFDVDEGLHLLNYAPRSFSVSDEHT